ncbi:T9SS type A sorting domain-containing protein [Aureivirga marina]|uniref:T9SS type A sorting domain-containing protein n=1 Tax=Aureivirga marina TaxID=1182451 RepID=UPI0018C95036|nr:T9SS type A sorting domain-containing protein [Aureivirga marina]
MKQKLRSIASLILIGTTSLYAQEYKEMIREGNFRVQEIQESADNYFQKTGKGKGTGYKQFKRWEFTALQDMDENGYLKPNEFYFEELKRVNQYQNRRTEEFETNDNWEELGPTYYNQTSGWNPGVGRITALAINPTNSSNIYIGSPTGGVWSTKDKGTNWTPLTDEFTNLVVQSLAIDPSDLSTVYWGSSNGRIYKSEDEGITWSIFANLSGYSVTKIAVHPTDSNIIYAAMSYGGFYRTLDGGENWHQVVSDNRGYDVEFNKEDPNIVYLSGSNFYKTTIDNSESITHSFSSGIKMIGVTAANPDKIYVIEEGEGIFNALYVSVDGGNNFNELDHGTNNYFGYSTSAADANGQAPRDMDIAVSPTDENEVHIAGILTWRSTNGGVTFQNTSDWVPGSAAAANVGYCHADVDILEFTDGELFVGSDGGLFTAENPDNISQNYYTDLTDGLGIRQFYKFGITQTEKTKISGGSQDNGSSIYDEETNQWIDWLGADGMETFFDINNPNIVYGTIYNGTLYKTVNGGFNSSQLPQGFYGDWVTPFEPDPNNSNTFYGGGASLNKTTNGGLSWTSISQSFGDYISDIEIAPTNNQVIYFGAADRLYKTNNGGDSWETVSGLFGRVRDIAIHPTNPDKIAVCINSSNQVYISNDGGDSWEQFDKNLPNFSKTSIVWQDDELNTLYVGMNYGIYMINDNLEEWVPFNNNLPNVRITELEINYVNQNIYVSTYGRGVWRSALYSPNIGIENHKFLEDIKIYPNPAKDKINIQWNENSNVSIRLFDQQGRIIKYIKDTPINQALEIDLSNYTNGIYFVRINSDKGVRTEKIVKN